MFKYDELISYPKAAFKSNITTLHSYHNITIEPMIKISSEALWI